MSNFVDALASALPAEGSALPAPASATLGASIRADKWLWAMEGFSSRLAYMREDAMAGDLRIERPSANLQRHGDGSDCK
jgi:hypothetical protein